MKQPKRILIVDDEKRNRNLLQAMLKNLGYVSQMAGDGTEALAKLGAGFDLVLLDVMMPGMDGFEVARRIRSHPDCSDIPIIMVTVLTGKEDRLRAAEAGANDFITKPIENVELRVRVASLLKMKEAQDTIKRHKAELEITVDQRTAELRASEERFRAIFESAEDCIFVQDRDLRYTQVNPFMVKLLGRPTSKILGLTEEQVFGEDEGAHAREINARVLNGESVEEERTRSVRGVPTTFLETRIPLRDKSGAITGVCGIARNVTERKKLTEPPQSVGEGEYRSPAMKRTLDRALLAARGDSMVLLTGESGSGKDYLARFIHDRSKRAGGPYFTINCAAIAHSLAESELFGHEAGSFTGASRRKKGLLELAEGGTLLLSEIGELSLNLQAKLLTFLDTKSFCRVGGEKSVSVSARLIAATNRDLEDMVTQGTFRKDLFYRLNVFAIEVPPLRDRTQDIPILVGEIMSQLVTDMQLDGVPEMDSATMSTLTGYSWPGNVRELRNVLERSLMISGEGALRIDVGSSAPVSKSEWSWEATFPPDKPLNDVAADLKRSLIREALSRSRGRKTEAARLLKITRDALKRQMMTLALPASD